ncbi:MAG TPA: aspartate/glutamate racemase family protein, partial [Edaphobacter sp.]|nr:aspartate/glutamate racemase family protein [Edaphobacter sp.]
FLHEQGAELLVIACNTATALALEDIQSALPIPVIGVVEPGAQAALTLSGKNSPCHPEQNLQRHSDQNSTSEPNLPCHPERSAAESKDLRFASLAPASANPALSPIENHVLVLATAATVQSHAYTRALNALGLEAYEKACPLLVPLVEEGWIDHPITDEVLKIYLTEALTAAPATQTLLLGCTHYPLLEPAIRRTLASLNHPLHIIDSAQATAHTVAAHSAIARRSEHIAQNCLFYATDSIEKFQRLGSNFLGQPVTGVRHIDLGG